MKSIFTREEQAVSALRELYHVHGYIPYRISKFEEYGLYAENQAFLLSQDVLSFTDTNGRLMALKPDVTLSLVKNTRAGEIAPRKLYYSENVYRADDRAAGFREIPQVGLECIGALSDTDRCEVVLLAAESLKLLGGDWLLDLSDMGLVCGMLDALKLDGELLREVLDCVRDRNLHGIQSCLGDKISRDALVRLKALSGLYGSAEEVLPQLRELLLSPEMEAAADRLALAAGVLPADRVRIDLSVMYETNYYCGLVFQGFLQGIPSRVLSGGCYDNLLRKMGKPGSAVGFAVYPDLLRVLEQPTPYDADVLLLTNGASPAACLQAAQAMIDRGLTVRLSQEIPAGRFGKILTVGEEDAENV